MITSRFLFIASGIGDLSIEDISLKAIPFSIVEISAVFFIADLPTLSLWLPKLMGYQFRPKGE